jgi:hypothetical protein
MGVRRRPRYVPAAFRRDRCQRLLGAAWVCPTPTTRALPSCARRARRCTRLTAQTWNVSGRRAPRHKAHTADDVPWRRPPEPPFGDVTRRSSGSCGGLATRLASWSACRGWRSSFIASAALTHAPRPVDFSRRGPATLRSALARVRGVVSGGVRRHGQDRGGGPRRGRPRTRARRRAVGDALPDRPRIASERVGPHRSVADRDDRRRDRDALAGLLAGAGPGPVAMFPHPPRVAYAEAKPTEKTAAPNRPVITHRAPVRAEGAGDAVVARVGAQPDPAEHGGEEAGEGLAGRDAHEPEGDREQRAPRFRQDPVVGGCRGVGDEQVRVAGDGGRQEIHDERTAGGAAKRPLTRGTVCVSGVLAVRSPARASPGTGGSGRPSPGQVAGQSEGGGLPAFSTVGRGRRSAVPARRPGWPAGRDNGPAGAKGRDA